MILDPEGIYLRRHGLGGAFIAGYTPMDEEEEEHRDKSEIHLEESSDTEVEKLEPHIDFNLFERDFRPVLSHRIPAFKDVEVRFLYTVLAGFKQNKMNISQCSSFLYSECFTT